MNSDRIIHQWRYKRAHYRIRYISDKATPLVERRVRGEWLHCADTEPLVFGMINLVRIVSSS